MKICSKCRVELPTTEFYSCKSTKDKLRPECKSCKKSSALEKYHENRNIRIPQMRKWAEDNKEERKIKNKKYHFLHREERLISSKEYRRRNLKERQLKEKHYRSKHREEINTRNKEWRAKNPEYVRISKRMYKYKRNGTILKALPAWANLEKIGQLYKDAKHLSEITGIKFHVDHTIPISSPLVCGLHVEGNLRIITARENLSKSNNFNID